MREVLRVGEIKGIVELLDGKGRVRGVVIGLFELVKFP